MVASPGKFRNEEVRNGNNPVTETKGRMPGGRISAWLHTHGKDGEGQGDVESLGSSGMKTARTDVRNSARRDAFTDGAVPEEGNDFTGSDSIVCMVAVYEADMESRGKNENRKEDQVSFYLG